MKSTCFSFLMLVAFLTSLFPLSKVQAEEVVVYTSVDQIFSEPILQIFEQKTGIRVKAVYDVEAAKTVGLVNRLLAEKRHPKADVFWNSEIVRTLVLKEKDVLAPYFSGNRVDIPRQFKDPDGFWTGFACRARVLIYNTRLLDKEDVPGSILELTAPRWKGKVAMPYPLLGTAATHMGALYARLGKPETERFLRDLKKNDILVVAGNSIVRDVVVAGEVPLGLTDTDDVLVAVKQGKPVAMIYPDQQTMGTFLIPNTVALVKNGPHPVAAKKLIDFLLSIEVESLLARSESGNIPVRAEVTPPENLPSRSSLNVMEVDYREAAGFVQVSDRFCRQLFTD